jgi:hypothetical protein
MYLAPPDSDRKLSLSRWQRRHVNESLIEIHNKARPLCGRMQRRFRSRAGQRFEGHRDCLTVEPHRKFRETLNLMNED